ncbi:HET-domain-containing protein, partial [Acephala macrosclerotiorum]
MWLLNTTTLQHHLFFGSNIPRYAILSHTWGPNEVSFQDLRSPPDGIQNWGGYCKIAICCQRAKNDGFQYAWVDTCCIDKTNNTELSEAINSMFAWYKKSGVCYVYLSDVETISDLPITRWFTRGWTLQELIAPRIVIFFNKDWEPIGSRDEGEGSLMNIISATTRIPPVALTPDFEPSDFSVAQIMSWASTRQTTREEDSAYCLLGLFGVHMPMIYGEGDKAFLRLQLEILKVSHDHTLFAWTRPRVNEWSSSTGPFAMAPSEFYECGNIERWNSRAGNESEYAMTNRGLSI